MRLEQLAAEQREREAARERALAEQRERERREQEELERAAREEKERLAQAKKDRLTSRGGVRGVRGTRASMRGMRGAAPSTRPGTSLMSVRNDCDTVLIASSTRFSVVHAYSPFSCTRLDRHTCEARVHFQGRFNVDATRVRVNHSAG